MLTLQIFYITVYISGFNENDRMIYATRIEQGSRHSIFSNPLTTVFYPDDQISSYQRTISSTTPMTIKLKSANGTQLVRVLGSESKKVDQKYPLNHKPQYSDVHRHKSTIYPTSPEKRTFFPEYDDTDYADSYRNVNSIQDIINQSNENDPGLVSSSMPFSRTMKVEGFYRREKAKRDQLSTMETMQSGTYTSMYGGGSGGKSMYDIQNKDPFSKFKPHSPSDVNLLATNIMKMKQYTHHKPRPVTTPMTLNSYYENIYNSQDPHIIYHQIIAANNKNREASARNRRFEKPMKNNKPFSLMLDVYPMPEDEKINHELHGLSSTRTTAHHQYNQHQRPFYPINSQAINHNLQYNKENPFYNHLKFHQLQSYPHNRAPYIMPHNSKEDFYPDYVTHRTNTNGYRPILRQPSHTIPVDLPLEQRPSQITVHLNLYPDRKNKYPTRNVEIVNPNDIVINPSRDDASLWKRLERPENTTTLQSIEVESSSQHPYIPPFSAIKINSLQQQFDFSDSNLLLQSEQPEKSIEFDMVSFDSKKLVPYIKPGYMNPTANSIITTSSSASSSHFDEIPSTISTEIPSTLSTNFETTMSSSIYSLPTNRFPFYSTTNPFETTTLTEVPNESKSEQPSIISGNTIRFED